MAQINKPTDYFNTVLYTGNGSTQSITGVGFTQDWTWIKERSQIENHFLFDTVRGDNKYVNSNTTDQEYTENGGMAFNSDGFTLGSWNSVNENNQTYASWNWLAGGTGVSNTDGSITSTVSANTTSGFSIVSYTGTGANATVGHGLGSALKMVIVKNRSITEDWFVLHTSASATAGSFLKLNLTGAVSSGNSIVFNNTNPTSTVFTVGTVNGTNGSGNNMIAYCFAEKKGFSKFGSYTGNGSTDGTFVYTGFKPAMIIIKNTARLDNWYLFDNKRGGFNVDNDFVFPNLSNAEVTSDQIDILSNGFKCRNGNDAINSSGELIIYMAFAENPLVGTNNIPAVAR